MANSEIPLQKVKAMIIDDHDPIRKAMKRVLAKIGIKNIFECFDGDEALKELARHPDVDLVLCDLYMRKVDGFQVLTHIRNRAIASDIPFMVVTGEASKDDIVKASDLGADDYVIKPFQAEAMEAKVLQMLTHFYSPPPLVKALRAGDRLMIHKHYAEALDSYQRALKLDASSMRAKHSMAVALDLCGNEAEALQILEQNIASSSTYYRNHASLANIYLRQGNPAMAIAAMKKELELNPKQGERQVQLAKLLLKQGDAQAAIRHFREALREDSRQRTALLGIGQAFAAIEDLEKAIYYFKRYRRHFPSDPRALQAMIKYSLQAKEPKRAEMALKDERQMHPERLDTHVYLAKFYMATNRPDDTLAALNTLFELEADHPEGLKVRGQIEMKEKKYAEALTTFTTLVQKAPDLEAYLAQAECMQRVRKPKLSIAVLHHALALAPGHAMALFLLAHAYRQTRQFSKAILVFVAAKRAGVPPEKCANNIKICWAEVKARREATFKLSA